MTLPIASLVDARYAAIDAGYPVAAVNDATHALIHMPRVLDGVEPVALDDESTDELRYLLDSLVSA